MAAQTSDNPLLGNDEIEFLDLVCCYLDDQLTPGRLAGLNEQLRNDGARRETFARYCLQAKLLSEALVAGTLLPDSVRPTQPRAATHTPLAGFLDGAIHGTISFFCQGMPLAYLLATVVTGLGLLIGSLIHVSRPEHVARNSVPSVVVEPKLVGKITGMVDCKWVGVGVDSPGVPLGRKYDLAWGLMEITYDTGAKVILQGPVTYEVESNGGYLSVGKLTGKLEKKVGSESTINNQQSTISNPSSLSTIHYPLFTIRTPTATVTDLGTEFGVEVNRDGDTETHVFSGAIKLVPGGSGSSGQAQIVHAGTAVRSNNGAKQVTMIEVNERQFTRVLPRHVSAHETKAGSYAKLVLSMKPVAYYRMERPADPKDWAVLVDSALSGRHGTLYGTNEFTEPYVASPLGRALRLEGDSYGLVRDLPGTDIHQLSVSAWVYAWHKGTWATIASEHDVDTGSGRVEQWNKGKTWQFHFGLEAPEGDLCVAVNQRNHCKIGVREGKDKPLPLGHWQHVAFVADGSVLRLYRGGVEIGSTPCDGVYAAGRIKHLTVGCKGLNESWDDPEVKPDFFWPGCIDELAIFNRALSAAEVRQLFGGRSRDSTKATSERTEKP